MKKIKKNNNESIEIKLNTELGVELMQNKKGQVGLKITGITQDKPDFINGVITAYAVVNDIDPNDTIHDEKIKRMINQLVTNIDLIETANQKLGKLLNDFFNEKANNKVNISAIVSDEQFNELFELDEDSEEITDPKHFIH